MLKMFQNTEGVVFQNVKEDPECWRCSRTLKVWCSRTLERIQNTEGVVFQNVRGSRMLEEFQSVGGVPEGPGSPISRRAVS